MTVQGRRLATVLAAIAPAALLVVSPAVALERDLHARSRPREAVIRFAVPDGSPAEGDAGRQLWEEPPDGSAPRVVGSVASPPLYSRDFRLGLTFQKRWTPGDDVPVTTVFLRASRSDTVTERSFHEDIWDPVWLPDGDAFAWIGPQDPDRRAGLAGEENAPCSIVIAPLLGRTIRHRFPCPAGEQILEIAPATSQTWAVVTTNSRGGNSTRRLFLWNLSQTNATPVGPPEEQTHRPSWSPDGRRLLYYVAPDAAPPPSLRMLDVATGRTITLKDGGEPFDFAWSPDGKFIAVAATAKWALEIRMLKVSTGEERVATSFPLKSGLDYISFPTESLTPMRHSGTGAWSPDGRRLLVRVHRVDPVARPPRFIHPVDKELFPITIADGTQTEVTDGEGPTWFSK